MIPDVSGVCSTDVALGNLSQKQEKAALLALLKSLGSRVWWWWF